MSFNVSVVTSSGVKEFHSDDTRYVALPAGTEYGLRLSNGSSSRCDADVYVDGKLAGSWLVPAHSSITIERPIYSNSKFKFYSEYSEDTIYKIRIPLDYYNGLVSVTFKPEKRYKARSNTQLVPSHTSFAYSNEQGSSYYTAALNKDMIDKDNISTVTLRLIVIKQTNQTSNISLTNFRLVSPKRMSVKTPPLRIPSPQRRNSPKRNY